MNNILASGRKPAGLNWHILTAGPIWQTSVCPFWADNSENCGRQQGCDIRAADSTCGICKLQDIAWELAGGCFCKGLVVMEMGSVEAIHFRVRGGKSGSFVWIRHNFAFNTRSWQHANKSTVFNWKIRIGNWSCPVLTTLCSCLCGYVKMS